MNTKSGSFALLLMVFFILSNYIMGQGLYKENEDSLLIVKAEIINADSTRVDLKELSDKELDAFKEAALKKTYDLGDYIKIIADKAKENEIKFNSINLAVKLFYDEEQIVQVSSKNNLQIRNYKIRQYLNNLRVLPYRRVEIEWYDVAYIREFKKGMDGKYYATITIFQKFKGYGFDDKLLYEDITQKDVEVVLDKRKRKIGDQEVEEWDVLLRGIKVVETT